MPTFVQSLRNRITRGARGLRSRHRLTESLKTLSLVAPLTLLIWILAERASLSESTTEVQFEVALTDPALDATVIDPPNQRLKLELTGPRARIDDLKTKLQQRKNTLRFQIETQYDPRSEQTLPVLDLVSSDPLIEQSGVTVTLATPTNVKIGVDAVIDWEVAVRLPDAVAPRVKNVVIDPATVVIRGPETAVKRLFPPEAKWIYLDVSPSNPVLGTTGVQELRDVPLVFPGKSADRVSVREKVVRSVRFEVAQSESEYTIPKVFIQVLKPIAMEGAAVVRLSQRSVTSIRVRGPEDAVSRLRGDNPTATPVAVLRIASDDAGRGSQRRKVDIVDLPPGVTVKDGDLDVEFSVNEVATPAE